MRKLIPLPIILIMMCWAKAAGADSVCLNNGNIIEGIITQETDGALEVEVFLGAKVTFYRQDVAYVKRWAQKQNDVLREKWLKDKQEREEAELRRQEFEAEQEAKGLVKYGDKWIAGPEREKLKTGEFVDEVLREKMERGEIAESGRKRTAVARSLLARGSWFSRQTERFIIYYEDVIQSKMVADRAEYYYEKIAYDLDYEKMIYWPDKCEVFIIPSEAKWDEYLQEFVESFDHIGGFVPQTGEREIYLCALSLPYLSVTFPHELTHLVFREFAKGEHIPLWLNEGLAIYESGLIGYADVLLREKVTASEHIQLKEMLQTEIYPKTKEQIELYYAEAEKTVEFLITQHGRKRFSHFCQLLISGQPFAQALNYVYGDDYYNEDEFNRAWIKYVLK